jgi:23S rRNA pseudouridine1911/1915/1917 synthase
MNRTRVKELLRSGRVSVNGSFMTRHDLPVRPGDRIGIARESLLDVRSSWKAHRSDLAVVYEDEAIIAIDKPAGLLSVASESEKMDTAFVRLKAHLEARKAGRPFVVHRIDRETSGLLLFARSAEVRDWLQANWDCGRKTYLAVVDGRPNPTEGSVDNFLVEKKDLRVSAFAHFREGAKRAISHYRTIATRASYSLVEVVLETGRKHQIRVHMAGLRCPVVGDAVYGSRSNPAGRLGLHAWRLELDHPHSGDRIKLESPFPEKLQRLVGPPNSSDSRTGG